MYNNSNGKGLLETLKDPEQIIALDGKEVVVNKTRDSIPHGPFGIYHNKGVDFKFLGLYSEVNKSFIKAEELVSKSRTPNKKEIEDIDNSIPNKIFGDFFKDQRPKSSLFDFPLAKANQIRIQQQNQLNNQSDDQLCSVQLQNEQTMSVNTELSKVNYEYKERSTVLKKIKLSKFRKDKGDLLENVIVALLYNQNSRCYMLSVGFTPSLPFYFAFIFKNKTKVTQSQEKPQNILITCFQLIQNKQKLIENKIRMQLCLEEQPEQIFQLLINIINGNHQIPQQILAKREQKCQDDSFVTPKKRPSLCFESSQKILQ